MTWTFETGKAVVVAPKAPPSPPSSLTILTDELRKVGIKKKREKKTFSASQSPETFG